MKRAKTHHYMNSMRGVEKNQVAWKPVSPHLPPWLELPEDVMANILHKLGPIGLLWTAQYVCTAWRKICRNPTMWRVIDMWKLGDVPGIYSVPHMGVVMLFNLAVDLSKGQVTEINIGEFGSDSLLEYIAERCSNLRCLRLAFCEDVRGKTISEAVKGFPLLEVLHLHSIDVRIDDIEAIGQSCPMLKSFALNVRACKHGENSNEALAVATFMPELHHLQLFANRMTNEGLEAILDGCPELESLDVRQCLNLKLDGELGERCAQNIKILRRPNDSTDDYGWETNVDDWGKYDNEYISDVDSSDDDEEDDDDDEETIMMILLTMTMMITVLFIISTMINRGPLTR